MIEAAAMPATEPRRGADWRAGLAPFAILLLPNALMLGLALWTANIREYLVNVDYLLVVFCLAAFPPGRRGRLALGAATCVMTLCLAADLFTAYQRIYFAGPMMLIDYLPFIALWPWGVILPKLAALILIALAIVWIGRPRGGRRMPLRAVLIFTLALVAIDIATAGLRARYLPPALGNLTSSAFKIVLQPSANQLRNRLMARPMASAPFPEPTLHTRIMGQAQPPARILSIAVESLGLERDPALRARLTAILVTGLAPDYRLAENGSHAFLGATIAGEARELCGIRLEGVPYRDRDLAVLDTCLPALLARRGYVSSAWHGSDGSFYNRTGIYPRMGFSSLHFFGDMNESVARPCAYLFVGICDADLLRLAVGSFGRHPRELVHVVTLDTHLPITNPTIDCAAAADAQLCLLRAMMDDVLRAIPAAVRAARVKPDLIAIYSDHGPPLLDGRSRRRFDEHRIPYLLFERVTPPRPSQTPRPA